MGVEPTIGRAFRPEEDEVPGRDAVVILGRTMWEQEFGADGGVLGRTVRINGVPFTIIGVAPARFTGMDRFVRYDFFIPLMMSPRVIADSKAASLESRDARNLTLKGRLKPSVSQATAQSELTAIATDLERAYPDTNKNRRFFVKTELQSRIAENPPEAMLMAMLSTLALAVLLVACANVAGLLTSRAPARAREMALRLAIGAGRGRLIRQLVTESLLIAIAGGVLGLAVGYAGMMLFRQIRIPTDLPIMLAFEMNQRALVFSLIVAMGSAVVFGLVPALQASRTDLTAVMKAADAVGRGRRRRWGRAVLVAAQVAIVRRPPRGGDVHVPWIRRAACGWSWLPHRPSAHDAFRHQLDPLHRRAVAAVLPAGRRTGACGIGCEGRHPVHLDPDVERLDRYCDDRARGLSVSTRQGERGHAGVESGRVLLRRHGHPAPRRAQFHPP